MRQVEMTGKTFEEAVEKALAELQATESDVDIMTVQEGSKGLLGLFGSRPYKVRVTLHEAEDDADELDVMSLLGERKPKQEPRKPAQPRQPKPRAEQPRPAVKPEAPAAKPETPAETPDEPAAQPERKSESAPRRPQPVRRVNPERKPAAETAAESEPEQETPAVEPAEDAEEHDASADTPAQPRKRRRRSRGGARKRAAAAAAAQEAQEGQEEQPEAPKPAPRKQISKPIEKPEVTMIPEEELDPESPAGKAKSFLMELTRLMGVPVTIEMGVDAEGNVYGYMNGDSMGILIGRRGETLDAIQFLTMLRVNRGRESYTRVTLDTENYRAKREDALIRLAHRKANHAVKTGRRVSLDPMNPYERRIIHSALQDNDAVDTHSEGEEPNRHVVITIRKA